MEHDYYGMIFLNTGTMLGFLAFIQYGIFRPSSLKLFHILGLIPNCGLGFWESDVQYGFQGNILIHAENWCEKASTEKWEIRPSKPKRGFWHTELLSASEIT